MSDERLEDICAEYRERAKQFPITRNILYRLEKDPSGSQHYRFRWGKFYVTIWYETHLSAPRWHATVTILEEVNELEFGAMQEALLAVESWTNEDMSQADHILGACLGPEILRDSQQVTVHDGLWSRHWITSDERGAVHGTDSIVTH